MLESLSSLIIEESGLGAEGDFEGTAWGTAADNVTRHPLCTAQQSEGQNLLKQENSLDPEIDCMVGTLQESPSKSLPPSDYGGEA